MRKKELAENEYYHVYNRGTEKRKIFLDDSDYLRFYVSMHLLRYDRIDLMDRWRDYCKSKLNANLDAFRRSNLRKEKRLVEFVSYCLNPNHYHFQLKQIAKKGIEKFMQKLGTSYTMYFNKKYDRNGVLFQGKFKSTHIGSTGLLLRLCVYINCNSEVHGIARAASYQWCSFPEYLGKKKRDLCTKSVIMDNFNSRKDFSYFSKENLIDIKQRKDEEKKKIFFE
ncbi:MAG: transposase [Patescibacteria group bacterium]|nr:transposase [Patescibacteria group bacterium]